MLFCLQALLHLLTVTTGLLRDGNGATATSSSSSSTSSSSQLTDLQTAAAACLRAVLQFSGGLGPNTLDQLNPDELTTLCVILHELTKQYNISTAAGGAVQQGEADATDGLGLYVPHALLHATWGQVAEHAGDMAAAQRSMCLWCLCTCHMAPPAAALEEVLAASTVSVFALDGPGVCRVCAALLRLRRVLCGGGPKKEAAALLLALTDDLAGRPDAVDLGTLAAACQLCRVFECQPSVAFVQAAVERVLQAAAASEELPHAARAAGLLMGYSGQVGAELLQQLMSAVLRKATAGDEGLGCIFMSALESACAASKGKAAARVPVAVLDRVTELWAGHVGVGLPVGAAVAEEQTNSSTKGKQEQQQQAGDVLPPLADRQCALLLRCYAVSGSHSSVVPALVDVLLGPRGGVVQPAHAAAAVLALCTLRPVGYEQQLQKLEQTMQQQQQLGQQESKVPVRYISQLLRFAGSFPAAVQLIVPALMDLATSSVQPLGSAEAADLLTALSTAAAVVVEGSQPSRQGQQQQRQQEQRQQLEEQQQQQQGVQLLGPAVWQQLLQVCTTAVQEAPWKLPTHKVLGLLVAIRSLTRPRQQQKGQSLVPKCQQLPVLRLDTSFWDALDLHLEGCAAHMTAAQTAGVMVQLAHLQQGHPLVWSALAHQARELSAELSAGDLSWLLWACAKKGYRSGVVLNLCKVGVLKHLPPMGLVGLAGAVGYGRSGSGSFDEGAGDGVGEGAVVASSSSSIRGSSSSKTASSSSGGAASSGREVSRSPGRSSPAVTSSSGGALAGTSVTSSAPGLAATASLDSCVRTLWSCVSLGYKSDLLRELLLGLVCHPESPDMRQVANVAWASAKLGLEVPDVLQWVEGHAAGQWGRATTQGLANTAWGLWKQGKGMDGCREAWAGREERRSQL